ncbi:MAG: C45 family peptidase, partial [Muribaculaceae bacterium]|nr:C45 family peptidase [Muribaculaceae bacterium]
GMNRAGLAIMNTASYNLMPDTATYKDREGYVMTLALEKCATVDDFSRLLDRLPRPLGVQANFGVIDAHGAGAYFETDDNGYTRIDVPSDTCITRTNYSHSGGIDGRLGVARECTANRFLERPCHISPHLFLDTLSRKYLDPLTGRDLTLDSIDTLLDNGNFIPRYISTSSIVIEAIPSETCDGSRYVMHTVLGYPPVGTEYDVTFDDVPEQVMLKNGGMTQAEREALPLKRTIFTGRRHGKHRVMDMNSIRKLK